MRISLDAIRERPSARDLSCTIRQCFHRAAWASVPAYISISSAKAFRRPAPSSLVARSTWCCLSRTKGVHVVSLQCQPAITRRPWLGRRGSWAFRAPSSCRWMRRARRWTPFADMARRSLRTQTVRHFSIGCAKRKPAPVRHSCIRSMTRRARGGGHRRARDRRAGAGRRMRCGADWRRWTYGRRYLRRESTASRLPRCWSRARGRTRYDSRTRRR